MDKKVWAGPRNSFGGFLGDSSKNLPDAWRRSYQLSTINIQFSIWLQPKVRSIEH